MIVLALRQIQLYPRTGFDQSGGQDAYWRDGKDMGNPREAGKKQCAHSDAFQSETSPVRRGSPRQASPNFRLP